jgi:hypothetical protein
MHVRDALDRLDAIHDHLARAEEYRGFRAAGVAAAGVVGPLGAALQPLITGPDRFVTFWAAVAAVAGALGGGPAVYAYLASEDEFARRRTRRVFAQFMPCVLVGAAVAVAAAKAGPAAVVLLPGLWAVLFGMGLLAARPYLPPAVGWVAGFYLAAGCGLLIWSAGETEPSGWAVGGVFGVGHLAAAVVLARGRGEGVADE